MGTLKRQRQVAKRKWNREQLSGRKADGGIQTAGRMHRPHIVDMKREGLDKIFDFLGFEKPTVREARELAEYTKFLAEKDSAMNIATTTELKDLNGKSIKESTL